MTLMVKTSQFFFCLGNFCLQFLAVLVYHDINAGMKSKMPQNMPFFRKISIVNWKLKPSLKKSSHQLWAELGLKVQRWRQQNIF